MKKYDNFYDWCADHQNQMFHFWVYSKMENGFKDSCAKSGYICECITLPDNDILIGFQSEIKSDDYVSYYKLSEIRLAYFTPEFDFIIPE